MEQSSSWEANTSSATQEILRILWNPKVHSCIHNSPPPVHFLPQIDPIHARPSRFSKIHFNIIHVFKSHIRFPLLCLYRRITLIPRLFWMWCNMIFLRWGVVSASPNTQAEGPPLVGCPRLLIQYIRSYAPYLEAVPPPATRGRAMPLWQGPSYHCDRDPVITLWVHVQIKWITISRRSF